LPFTEGTVHGDAGSGFKSAAALSFRAGLSPRLPVSSVSRQCAGRALYERRGWHDEGPVDYTASSENGPMSVPCERYTKRVRS